MSTTRVGDLEVSQDLAIERKAWTAQRIGWGLMALFLGAGALGVFGGSGPLASATATSGGLRVEYERFCRHGGEARLDLEVAASEQRGGQAVISFDREYLAGMTLEDILPEPREAQASPDAVRLTFAAAGPGAPIRVRVVARPHDVGRQRGRVAVEGGSAVELRQLTYP